MRELREVDAQRVQTEALIAVRGVFISLIRPGEYSADSSALGVQRIGAETPLPPVRRYYQATKKDESYQITVSGQLVNIDYVMIGLTGDDIREGDYFSYMNQRHVIRFIDPTTLNYQTKALVMLHASL